MPSRRRFLSRHLPAASLAFTSSPAANKPSPLVFRQTSSVSLNGDWIFRTDPEDQGEKQSWWAHDQSPVQAKTVQVPHTWQTEAALADYRGVAWYRRTFDTPQHAGNSALRLEFEAVFHSARVWVNGTFAGEHLRKPYTAFTLDVGPLLRADRANSLVVRVDHAFNSHTLPRGRPSDWAHDGGNCRPVQLLVTSSAFIECADVDALPNFQTGDASLDVVIFARSAVTHSTNNAITLRVVEEAIGNSGDRGMGVLRQPVQGVVDAFCHPKPSYQLLRTESSSIHSLGVEGHPTAFELTLRTSKTVPSYILRAYELRAVYYGYGDIPVEQQDVPLPDLAPGQEIKLKIAFAEDHPEYIQFDILGPTEFSAHSQIWKT
jgi:hypothetical protein